MGETPSAEPATDSLYGAETAATRAWVIDYIARNRAMLDLMARL